MHVVAADCPILLRLSHMYQLKFYFNNLINHVVYSASGQFILLSRKFRHWFI